MTTFGEALKKGLAAHERAAQARTEMDEVLAAASKDVTAAIGCPISFVFEIVDRPARERTISESITGAPAPRQKFTALVAHAGAGNKILAEASFGEIGYPVRLRWEDNVDLIHDRASFEEALKALLSHGATGEKIAALIQGGGEVT